MPIRRNVITFSIVAALVGLSLLAYSSLDAFRSLAPSVGTGVETMPSELTATNKGDLGPGSKILVTGASGFLATHIVSLLLDSGFTVVGTVRSSAKGDFLVNDLFKGRNFSYAIVEDMQAPTAFDEAVKDVDGIAHTASPFHLNAVEPIDIIDPAVRGTANILNSALKCNRLKRVVLTSSVAAIITPAEPPRTFTEADGWNDFSVAECDTKGRNASAIDKYQASKTLAEQAAWAFTSQHTPSWSLTAINPAFVFGPIIHQTSLASLSSSVKYFYWMMRGGLTEKDLPGKALGNWVDVREVAKAHVQAFVLPSESIAGERFIVSAGPYNLQQITTTLHAIAPTLPNIPTGLPGAEVEANLPENAVRIDGGKAQRVLGLKYRSLESCVEDMYESILARQWT